MVRRPLFSLALPLCVGCGTMMNLSEDNGYGPPLHRCQGQRFVYGGTAIAADGAAASVSEIVVPTPLPVAGKPDRTAYSAMPIAFWAGAVVWTVDLPLSLIADTFTLPVTVPAAIGRAVDAHYGLGGAGHVPLPDTGG